MINPEHLKILERGVEEWNKWRKENENINPVLTGVDLRETNLSRANLRFTDLSRANLRFADLSGVDLSGADLSRANLSGANLLSAHIGMATSGEARIYKDGMRSYTIRGADLRGADLREANLGEVSIDNANLSGADLESACLRGANIYQSDLRGVNLRFADLSGADLRAIDYNLYDAGNFIHTLVNNPDVNLNGANLREANLSGANLSGADLHAAHFSKANLHAANLSGANLSGANFTKSKLVETNFKESILYETIFGLTDLSTCEGLDSVKVSGKCVIDFETLQKSKLSRLFLTKIGLTELYIDYLPSFVESPINLFPVFLSHSWDNKDFAEKLYEALIARGVQVWYDEKKMKPGDDILESIDKGINLYDKMILVCSEASLNSWWVEEELERLFEKERKFRKEHNKKLRLLIPVTIDDAILNSKEPLAKSIRKRAVGKFQEWQNKEKFNNALNDLITALNVDRGDDPPISFL